MPKSGQTAARKPQNGKAETRSIAPFKFQGRLIAAVRNEEGEIMGEAAVAEMAIYATEFGELAQKVAEVWPEIEKAWMEGRFG